jgi:hypothetical protein
LAIPGVRHAEDVSGTSPPSVVAGTIMGAIEAVTITDAAVDEILLSSVKSQAQRRS